MKISVLTATYNREKLLLKLFESLKKNYETYKDFEWIIMDDGSSDNTEKEVKKWIKEVNFKIDYHYQYTLAIGNNIRFYKCLFI